MYKIGTIIENCHFNIKLYFISNERLHTPTTPPVDPTTTQGDKVENATDFIPFRQTIKVQRIAFSYMHFEVNVSGADPGGAP